MDIAHVDKWINFEVCLSSFVLAVVSRTDMYTSQNITETRRTLDFLQIYRYLETKDIFNHWIYEFTNMSINVNDHFYRYELLWSPHKSERMQNESFPTKIWIQLWNTTSYATRLSRWFCIKSLLVAIICEDI